jgi:hypothetical protein
LFFDPGGKFSVLEFLRGKFWKCFGKNSKISQEKISQKTHEEIFKGFIQTGKSHVKKSNNNSKFP